MQYTVQGQLIPAPASLGKECWDQGVLKAVISTTGVVALTATLQLWAIPDLKVRIRPSLSSHVLTSQYVSNLFPFSLLYACLHRYMCMHRCLTHIVVPFPGPYTTETAQPRADKRPSLHGNSREGREAGGAADEGGVVGSSEPGRHAGPGTEGLGRVELVEWLLEGGLFCFGYNSAVFLIFYMHNLFGCERTHVCRHVCVCLCMCMYASLYVCMYVYI